MANGHGGPRPNSGRKIGSKTKSTEALGSTMADLARQHCPAAIKVLVTVMHDDEAPPAARVRAADSILDRGYGRPPQQVMHSGDQDAPIRQRIEMVIVDPAGDAP